MRLSQTSLGIVCALAAGGAFTLNDAGVKYLSGDYALHQIVFIRSSVALVLALLIVVPLEGGLSVLKTRNLSLHIYRGLSVVVANLVFFAGIAALPLAEVTAIFFISPLVLTAMSVVFLGERVGIWRWTAVAVGMFGALVIIRPGTDAFQLAAILPALAAVFYAILHILTRKIGQTDKASAMLVYSLLAFLFVSGAIGLFAGDGRFAGNAHPSVEFLARPWVVPPFQDGLVMIGLGFLATIAVYLISQAYRLCEVGLIAPFEYTALILAIIWGITLFGEWPPSIVWFGIGLIILSGLFIVWREQVSKKSP